MLFRVQKVWIPDGYYDWSSVETTEYTYYTSSRSKEELEQRIVREQGFLEEWCEHRRARGIVTITPFKECAMDLIKKVKDLVAALKANDWSTSISLTLAIIAMITQGWNAPQQMKASSAKFASASDSTLEELAKELDDCCPQELPLERGADLYKGPVIDMMLPILLAILRKLIGF